LVIRSFANRVFSTPMRRYALRFLLPVLTMALIWPVAAVSAETIPVYGYKVVHRYPHDPVAFTEGLFYKDGYLYESTGEKNESWVRKVKLETGKVVQQIALSPTDFGEGIIAWKNQLIQLTWRQGIGHVYDLDSFKSLHDFQYPGEGWALTKDASHLYMSDGTPDLRILDPETLAQTGSIHVTADGSPVFNLNELEWVKGEIYANIWQTDRIARIDPATGHVVGWIDLSGLLDTQAMADPVDDVLNGIAYDAKHDRLFVTGKRWPTLFEIRLTPPISGKR
jgi:glutaminyl-peptide cyclotransferase